MASYATTNDVFTQGLKAARNGDLVTASTDFESDAQHQPSVGALLNLGLAEWQLGHAGPAMLAWEQAQWIDPFDPSAAQNLKFARQIAQVNEPAYEWFETASTWLPPNAWVWLAGGSLWLVVGILTLPAVLRIKKAGWHQTVAALGLGVFLFSITANVGVVSRTHLGIVLRKNTPLLLTPTREGEVISTLTAGESARRLRTRNGYLFVRTAYGTGWISQKNLGFINGR